MSKTSVALGGIGPELSETARRGLITDLPATRSGARNVPDLGRTVCARLTPVCHAARS
jgi:hypothetical protein